MADIRLVSLNKRFGKVEALHDFSLEIADGEFMVLVGPSGCGKTTALRVVSGLETPDGGDVFLGGRRVTDVLPRDRDIAMVFQNYALYPHMTVFENMAFGLRRRRTPREEIGPRVRRAADMMGIADLLERKPHQLSGGQRQRVAVCRAIVRDPAVFLFDEPLSNLDAKLRVSARWEIKKLIQNLGTTAVYVTHDQTEAMTMGDRIAILNEGRLQQVGTPSEIYNAPVNTFVAGFIGSPAMNMVRGPVVRKDAGLFVEALGALLPLPAGVSPPGEVVVGIRPEDVSGTRGKDSVEVRARVEMIEYLGSEMIMNLRVDGNDLVVREEGRFDARVGQALSVYLDREMFHFFDASTGERIGAPS